MRLDPKTSHVSFINLAFWTVAAGTALRTGFYFNVRFNNENKKRKPTNETTPKELREWCGSLSSQI